MNFIEFSRHEIKDRATQKGISTALWNILMFPITLFLNYTNYKKWIKLLKKIKIEKTELKNLVDIKIIEERVSTKEALNKLDGTDQPILRMNKGYILDLKELYIFPIYEPENRHHFYTEIQEPLIISFNNSRHPFQTLWKIPALKSIVNIELKKESTIIDLKGEKFNNKIRFKISKQLKLTEWKKKD